MNQTEKLDQAITDYLLWMIEQNYSGSTWSFYSRVLERFRKYLRKQDSMDWETGIQATSRYLSIQTDMMREVLFHETL